MAIHLTRPIVSTVDPATLDDAVRAMIQNDLKMLPQAQTGPKVWRCGWYNTSLDTKAKRAALCYKAGDAVWLNTENLDQFTRANMDYIRSVVEGNGALRYKYAEIQGDDEKVLEMFKGVVSGTVRGRQDGLPLFFLGSDTGKTRIRVSTKDDNDRTPDDDSCWTDFFEDNSAGAAQSMLSCADDLLGRYMAQHLKEYHLSGVESYWYDENSRKQLDLDDFYLHNTLSNLTGEQQYVNTRQLVVQRGFDWVIKYFCRKFGSGGRKWFRVWNSGLVEHGGVLPVDGQQATAALAGDWYELGGKGYAVRLDWDTGTGIGRAPAYSYGLLASGFYYSDSAIDPGDGAARALPEPEKTVSPHDRYTVQLTLGTRSVPYSTVGAGEVPPTRGWFYATADVYGMKNQSFSFVLPPDCTQFDYHVTGFVPNSQQRYR